MVRQAEGDSEAKWPGVGLGLRANGKPDDQQPEGKAEVQRQCSMKKKPRLGKRTKIEKKK